MKPIFSDKKSYNIKINLIENNKIVTEDNKIAECFKNYFENSVKELNIDMDTIILSTSDNIDNVMNYIHKFKIHPSILKIKYVVNIDKTFNFDFIDITNMTNPINSIPAKIIISNCDIFLPILHNNFNNNIINRIFPINLKLSDITPTHKKNDRLLKENYRPISIFPAISKIYEKLMAEELNKYFEHKFSIFQCDFRKGFNAQHCLIYMIEKWKISLDKKGAGGALLADLSKAFDCLDHDLLIAKLEAYGVGYPSLHLINSYLSNRIQRVKVNSTFNSSWESLYGVPQGSILGHLLFNIYLCDLFNSLDDPTIVNYADDNTPFSIAHDINSVIKKIESNSIKLFQWLANNVVKANHENSHLLLSNKHNNLYAP